MNIPTIQAMTEQFMRSKPANENRTLCYEQVIDELVKKALEHGCGTATGRQVRDVCRAVVDSIYVPSDGKEDPRDALIRELVEALRKAYRMLIAANLRDHPEENQRCGRCGYCEALLSNADDDDCEECYPIVKAIAAFTAYDSAATGNKGE